MKRSFVVLLFMIVLVYPNTASAQLDLLWDWGERFIGPGPWTGYNAVVRFHCGKMIPSADPRVARIGLDPNDPWCWDDDSDATIKAYVELRSGIHHTGGVIWNHHPVLFGDLPPETERMKIIKLEPFVMTRLNPAIDIGAGAGVNQFYGEGFSFSRFLLTPLSILITPGAALYPDRKKWRFLKIRYEMNYMPQGLDAEDDFNRPSGYHMDTEWTSRAGIQLDFLVFKRN
jgi:hypothetical protein